MDLTSTKERMCFRFPFVRSRPFHEGLVVYVRGRFKDEVIVVV